MLVLASQSKARARLLRDLGIEFVASPSVGVVERMDPRGDVKKMVEENALAKAKAVAGTLGKGIVVGCDTVLYFEGKVIGKPRDEQDATRILSKLSDKWHEIVSGIALVDATSGKSASGADVSRVKFKQLSAARIRQYVESGEAMDKAGAYAWQDHGKDLVESFEGSEANIIGLPAELLPKLSAKVGWDFRVAASFWCRRCRSA